MTKDFTHEMYAKAYAADAQRAVNVLADELELLTKDLRAYAESFIETVSGDSFTSPTGRAADIVSKYTSRIGSGGARLFDLVYNAGQAEAYRAQIPHEVS